MKNLWMHITFITVALTLFACTQGGKTAESSRSAEVDVAGAQITDSEVAISQHIGDQSIIDVSDVRAGGTGDGLKLRFPAAMLAGAGGALATLTEPIEVTIPRQMISTTRVNLRDAAKISLKGAQIKNSVVTINSTIGSSAGHMGGKVLAYVDGEMPDGTKVGAVTLPESQTHASEKTAAKAAGIDGLVIPIEIAAASETFNATSLCQRNDDPVLQGTS